MENILPELVTVSSGLAILGVSYLTSLLAALANVFGSHTDDTFSWRKLGRGLAKAGIWALAVVSFTLVMNLLMWFSSRVDLDIEGILKDTNVIGLIGIVLTASATYISNAYDNIKFFILKGGESQIDTSNANPDYKGIADDVKKIADKITPHWTANEKQTCEEAEEVVKDVEVGQGASVNPLSRRLPDGDNCSGAGWQCSKYAYYLGTGIVMNYAPNPSYGPCNGIDMCDYLINNYGFVPCGKIAGAIFSYASGEYGHCGMVVDPASDMVNDANWVPLTVSTHYLNLDAVGARYCCPPDMLPPEPTPEPTPAPSGFNVGDVVTLINWVDYNGTPLTQTKDYYFISELDDDRAVLRADSTDGVVYAAVNTRNLEKVNTPAPQPDNSFRVGDVVIPTVLVDYYGTELYRFDDTYVITELDGNRAVLCADRNGNLEVWCAYNTDNLEHA